MAKLNLEPNLDDPDGFYAELLAAHEGLSEAESSSYNARLILILANQIGSRNILSEALRAAMQNGAPASTNPPT